MITNLHSLGFIWFFGVVEDRTDPLMANRVRVRVHGINTADKNDLPTTELLWAQVMMPVTSAGMSGVGELHGLVEGSMVAGFFADGPAMQNPVIMGSFSGIPQAAPDASKGFNDPNGVYPKSEYLDEPDVSRLARGEEAERHRVLKAIVDGRITDISVAKANSLSNADDIGGMEYEDSTWNQPNPRFGGEDETDRSYGEESGGSRYPYNKVYESEAGHYEEYDDTPDNERICRSHTSGTFEEILPDGTRVIRVVGSSYRITASDEKVQISGSCQITIEGDSKVLVKGNKYEEVLGNYHLTVGGKRHVKVGSEDAIDIAGDQKEKVSGGKTQDIAGTLDIDAGSVDMDSSGTIDIDGQMIELN